MTTDKQYHLVKKDIVSLEEINIKIHNWLLKNRVGYNSKKWSDVIENYSNIGEFAIPLPPESNLGLSNEDRIGMIEGKLPTDWFKPTEII